MVEDDNCLQTIHEPACVILTLFQYFGIVVITFTVFWCKFSILCQSTALFVSRMKRLSGLLVKQLFVKFGLKFEECVDVNLKAKYMTSAIFIANGVSYSNTPRQYICYELSCGPQVTLMSIIASPFCLSTLSCLKMRSVMILISADIRKYDLS